jgi:hypothetical protein
VIGRWSIHGHAIVSADDRIANETGVMPPSLRNEADWVRFQAALDGSVLTVLGRLSHEASPNRRRRRRLVLSSAARGIERRGDVWWWNPQEVPVTDALERAAPEGGVVAVPGGRRVFDLFLGLGFDAFHLARAERIILPAGIPIFSAVEEGYGAAAILASAGLVSSPMEWLDRTAGVSMTVWRRA